MKIILLLVRKNNHNYNKVSLVQQHLPDILKEEGSVLVRKVANRTTQKANHLDSFGVVSIQVLQSCIVRPIPFWLR